MVWYPVQTRTNWEYSTTPEIEDPKNAHNYLGKHTLGIRTNSDGTDVYVYCRMTDRTTGIGYGELRETAGGDVVFVAFEAISADDTTGEILLLETGVGGGIVTRTTTQHGYDQVSDTWKEYSGGEAVFTGRKVENWILDSGDLNGPGWNNLGTVTPGVTDPVGGSGAFRCENTYSIYASRILVFTGYSYRISSIWVRNVSGTGIIRFDDPDDDSTIAITITSEWKRYAVSIGSTRSKMYFYLRSQDINDVVEVAFPQFELTTHNPDITAPGEYVETGATTAHKVFSTTLGNTVTSNVVTEGTGTELDTWGLVVEPPRTNAQIQSNDQSNVEYTKTTTTATFDQTGLTGHTNTATLLTATAPNSTTIANIVTAAISTHSTKWYLKRSTGTGTIELTLDGGTTWTDISSQLNFTYFVGISLEQSALTDPQIGVRIGSSGDAVIVGNAELYLDTPETTIRAIPYPVYITDDAGNTTTDDAGNIIIA